MYFNKKILAIIPARAGSKGIKNKNIVDLCDKPLIEYSIQAARESKFIDEIVVSTDGSEIAEVSRAIGARVPFLRPKELATDKAKTIDAIVFTIDELKRMGEIYDVLVLLQPTAPLRTSEDIDAAIEKFFDKGMRALVSVSLVDDHPMLIRTIENNDMLKPLLSVNSTCRRQDMPLFYRVNGAIYVNRIEELSLETSFNDNTVPFVMKREHSIDIDDPTDLLVAEALLMGL